MFCIAKMCHDFSDNPTHPRWFYPGRFKSSKGIWNHPHTPVSYNHFPKFITSLTTHAFQSVETQFLFTGLRWRVPRHLGRPACKPGNVELLPPTFCDVIMPTSGAMNTYPFNMGSLIKLKIYKLKRELELRSGLIYQNYSRRKVVLHQLMWDFLLNNDLEV